MFLEGGTDYGLAKAGTDHAETYFKQGVCAPLNWGFNVFCFEAFNEPWKPKSIGDTGLASDETHWGFFTAEREPLFSLSC